VIVGAAMSATSSSFLHAPKVAAISRNPAISLLCFMLMFVFILIVLGLFLIVFNCLILYSSIAGTATLRYLGAFLICFSNLKWQLNRKNQVSARFRQFNQPVKAGVIQVFCIQQVLRLQAQL
jgi:hypothetical protein